VTNDSLLHRCPESTSTPWAIHASTIFIVQSTLLDLERIQKIRRYEERLFSPIFKVFTSFQDVIHVYSESAEQDSNTIDSATVSETILSLGRFESAQTRAASSPHRAGRLSCAFPTELVLFIWSLMPLTDLLMYGSTSKFNFAATQAFLQRKRFSLVKPFFTDVQLFFRMLKTTQSLVSGSFALAFMVPADSLGWTPKDMDIYTSKQSVATWEKYLHYCGYRTRKPSSVTRKGYPVYAEVREVIYYEHITTGYGLDIIVATNKLPKPLFCYHSTPVMNYFSGDGFFSAYPELTGSLRGLINPSTTISFNIPPSRVADCLRKYAQRGFSLAERPSAWADDHHRCGRSWPSGKFKTCLRHLSLLNNILSTNKLDKPAIVA
jgi:hypothetical protein